MNAIQQKCRPKHQVLVLKCYPRMTKGAVDVKPNSSELSYLLFYAQSRRTKIQKVGSFLEKKTASDVYRQRIGNVQVTLQILAALIEKAPKDLPLFAPYVLKILDQVLRSNDITMVESSIPTFEAFCEHHDASSLFADQSYLRQYESVVHHYAALASTRQSPGKVQSKPVSMRWRNSGLEAIRSVASSDALSSVSGRQYDVVVPMILENLWTDNEDFLEVLLQRAQMEEKLADSAMLRRRTSVATVRTVDTAGEANPNPIALSGTAVDVDKLAEEDIGVLAMQCLKQIFVVPIRSQIHSATVALLQFIEERVSQSETVVRQNYNSGKDSGWAIKMFALISRWTPVQDRYIILVTAMDTMRRLPMTDQTLQQHIVLVAMAQSLLRSDVNLIGLSVMDVLQQLVLSMQKLVQLPGDPSGTGGDGPRPGPGDKSPSLVQQAELITSQRKELLGRLQQCLGDLATHVYYADQISDMISAILLKLKPRRSSSTANSSPRGEKADAAGGPSASATLTTEDSHLDSLFALTVAKIAALKAVKSILLVANPQRKVNSNVNLSRNRVPIQVWEHTHWLLRDPDGQVRKAYADALLTWLDRETTKADLKARDETTGTQRSTHKSGRELPAATIARRAASAGSQRDKPVKLPRSHFLQLIHVAIYDNALQFVDYETDMVLLHVLLAKLTNHLGVNAVRYGLPMIFRLQEDIQDAETPLSKVRIGSLCHGYFWTLTEKFDFEASVVGRAIHNEIVRRRSKHFWVEGIHVPAPLLELVGTPGMARPQPKMPLSEIESEALLPFDDRLSLVECICTAYQETTISPPGSPAASPGRSFSHPVLGSTLSTIPAIEAEQEIPSPFREQMLTEWTREAAMLAIQAGSKSASLSGSRTGTTGTNRNRLAVNGGQVNGNGGGPPSPFGSQQNLRPSSQPAVGGGGGNLAPGSKLRKSSVRSNLSRSAVSNGSATHSGTAVTTVDQLKLALSGQLPVPSTAPANGLMAADDDGSSDSMVSYDMAPSELSFNNPPSQSQTLGQSQPGEHRDQTDPSPQPRTRSVSRERKVSPAEALLGGGPLSSHPTRDPATPSPNLDSDAELVPPVPPLPATVSGGSEVLASRRDISPENTMSRQARRSTRSRGGDSILSGSFTAHTHVDEGTHAAAAMDLNSLLKGIDSRAGESSLGNVSRPPY